MADTISVTAATVANMRRYEEAHPPKTIDTLNGPMRVHAPRCFAYSTTTGEEFSGTAGDYFMVVDEDEPLTDSEGDDMVLVTSRVVHFDALTGEAI